MASRESPQLFIAKRVYVSVSRYLQHVHMGLMSCERRTQNLRLLVLWQMLIALTAWLGY